MFDAPGKEGEFAAQMGTDRPEPWAGGHTPQGAKKPGPQPPACRATRTMRELVANAIDDLLLLLDEIDGDPDLEDDTEDEEHDGREPEDWT